MRLLTILGVLAAAFAGCSLADALENAPCNTDDDCLGDQSCVRTLHTETLGGTGTCRSDGTCAAGEQLGCIVDGGGGCDIPYTVTPASNGSSYCCDGFESSISAVSEDGLSAQCLSCASDLCESGEEACVMGDARCTLVDALCGCRVPDDAVENSDCADASTCGEGFVCTRTLEQEAEPAEDTQTNQAEQPGSCRPEASPGCAIGEQDGCRKDSDSCTNGLTSICSGSLCYCCEPPVASGYSTFIYDIAADESSAACTWCPTGDCPGANACTAESDADCIVPGGELCGCTPAT
jgi:hypothetical protein